MDRQELAQVVREAFAALDDVFAPEEDLDGATSWAHAIDVLTGALAEGALRPAVVQTLVKTHKRREAARSALQGQNEEGALGQSDKASTIVDNCAGAGSEQEALGSTKPTQVAAANLTPSIPRHPSLQAKPRASVLGNDDEEGNETPEAREKRVLQSRRKALLRFVSGANVTLVKLIAIHDTLTRGVRGISTVEMSKFTDAVTAELVTDKRLSRRRSELFQQQTSLASVAVSEKASKADGASALSSRNEKVSPEIFNPLLFDMLGAYEEALVKGSETSQLVQSVRRRSMIKSMSPAQQQHVSYRQRRAVTLRLVDFRQLLFQMARALACGVRERVAFFFRLYGENNEISIDGLCALLYLGDRLVASSLQEAERFIRSLDQDGDDSITLEEFEAAIEKNPFILESMVRSHAAALQISGDQQQSLRAFVHRTSLSWAGMCTLWTRLQTGFEVNKRQGPGEGASATPQGSLQQSSSAGGAAGHDDDNDDKAAADGDGEEQGRVLMTKESFESRLCGQLRPPEPDDPQLVHELSAAFVGRVRPGWVDARAFVSALGATLGELNVGISDCHHKGKLYFALHNLDNDGVLTRDEVYHMLFTSSSAMGRKILKAAAVLRAMDANGDGVISFDEFMLASHKNPSFLKFFQAL